MDKVYVNNIQNEEGLKTHVKSLMDKEKWHDAQNLLIQNQDITNKSNECLRNLGFCYSKQGDYSKSSKIFEELCKKEPWNAKWFYYLAYQYKLNGEADAAIEAYEKCIELYPLWLKVYLELGKMYEDIDSTDSINNAIKVYREGFKVYREISPEIQKNLAQVYSKLCTQAAKLLESSNKLNDAGINEIEFLFKESTIYEPENSDTWYRLGNFFLNCNKHDEALQNLEKAKSLTPKKVYISHKIAQTFYGKDNLDQALKVYESIPDHKRTDYILHGMSKCLLKQGRTREGARYLFKAIKQDPNKFYLHRDFGLALMDLGDRDQGIEELEMANKLYKKDNGEDHNKIIAKIEESRSMPQGERIVFEESVSSKVTISYGVVTKYNSERGFGFIKDDKDDQDVFFHVSSLKKGIKPPEGTRVKFTREMGKKGLQAGKVWILKTL